MSEGSDTAPAATGTVLPRAFCVRRGGIAMACALLAVGLIFVWQASLLDFGGLGLPRPRFFSLLLGAVLGASSAVIGLSCWRESGGKKKGELGHLDCPVRVVALPAWRTG